MKRHFSTVQLVLGIVLAAILFTALSLAWPLIVHGGPPSPLKPEHMRLIAEKEQARRNAGIPTEVGSDNAYVKENVPVRQFSKTIKVTKEELERALETSRSYNQGYAAQLREGNGFAAADQLEQEYAQQKQNLERLSDNALQMDVPGVEIGHHSITFSALTYDGSYKSKDPTNIVFYRQGSAFDVNFDMRYWTRLKWKDTGWCGGWQQVYIWDSSHSGGRNGWKGMNYQLERGADWYCGSPRYHIRLFGSFVRDSHSPSFGLWTVAAAHHDNQWHNCPDDWESSELLTQKSFQNSNGTPMWFVGVRWQANFGNAGRIQCAYNDGKGRFIELLY